MNEVFKTFVYNMQIVSYSNLFYFIRTKLIIYLGSIGASSVELEWRGRGMNYTLEWRLKGDDIW